MLRQAWRRMVRRGANSLVVAIALFLSGLYLVGLPVIFAVFAHETGSGQHFGRRVSLIVLWFVCAVVVGLVATAGDVADLRQRARETFPKERRVGDRRELAALSSIAALLEPGAAGLSSSFVFNAFIADHEGCLVPVLERRPAPWQRWPPGHGVVGIAWEHPEAFVQAAGADTVDPELGLSSEQREHYGHLTFVAAKVILNDADRQIGVLAVSCQDGSDFASSDGADRFELLASDMGILIGDAGPAGSEHAL